MSLTKTMILAIVIAGIIGVGIIIAYAEFIKQTDVAPPTTGGLTLPVGCTDGQTPVWNSTSGSWKCGIPVSALIIGGKFYPLIQMESGQHPECPPYHAHVTIPMAVAAYDLSKILRPADVCGYGVIGMNIHQVTIFMSQDQIDAWNLESGLLIPQ